MSQLEDLYRTIILDHYKNPRNQGEITAPEAKKAEGNNPLCGDKLTVTLLTDQDNTVLDIKIQGHGCSISQSSASMMTAAVKGKTISEIKELTSFFKAMLSIEEKSDSQEELSKEELSEEELIKKIGDLAALQGVVKFPVRIKCATLSWNTLTQALEEPTTGTPATTETPITP